MPIIENIQRLEEKDYQVRRNRSFTCNYVTFHRLKISVEGEEGIKGNPGLMNSNIVATAVWTGAGNNLVPLFIAVNSPGYM